MLQFKEGDILQFKTHVNIRRIIGEVRSTGYSYMREGRSGDEWDTRIFDSEDTSDPFFEDGWRLYDPQSI